MYFAYTALVSPDKLAELAPDAEFSFIAHLPEWKLVFPYENGQWRGGLPSATPGSGNTVWGVVFQLSKSALAAIDANEKAEGRTRATVEIMDRNGRRHEAVTHLFDGSLNGDRSPSADYLRMMLVGGRHWKLPAGWIAGLEEHLQRA